MKIANVKGRATIIVGDSAGADVASLSGERFPSDIARLFLVWDEFIDWANTVSVVGTFAIDAADFGPLSPSPRQVFAIGLNYRDHADESGFTVPESPTVFTKFVSSITGPNVAVELPEGGHVDWEVELVAVIGKVARQVSVDSALSYVAGLTLGQDISERILQSAGPAPQFSLGKSFAGFGPMGPWMATLDEFEDPNDVGLHSAVNGEIMQSGRSRDLVFSVPELVSRLSRTVTLLPGDVIFTGTPSGVGLGRTPQVWLKPGDELRSWADHLGEMKQTMRETR